MISTGICRRISSTYRATCIHMSECVACVSEFNLKLGTVENSILSHSIHNENSLIILQALEMS